jgi:hypothetical protein
MRASAVQGAGAVEGAAFNVCLFRSAILVLTCSAHDGTAPTLDVDIEGYDPASESWYAIVSFTQSTTVTSQESKYIGDGGYGGGMLPAQIRWKATVGGSATPTKTFSIGAICRR